MALVLLFGELGKRFGKRHSFEIRTPAEAIRALSVNYPGFERHLLDRDKAGVRYKVFVGRHGVRDAETELRAPCGQQTIRIVPTISGAGGNGTLQVIVGAVLIVIGAALFWMPGAGPVMTQVGLAMMISGAGMTIGGVVQMLTPVPKSGSPQESEEHRPSYTFNGPVNTTAQGHPVPVGYGRMIVGSAVISAGMTVEQI